MKPALAFILTLCAVPTPAVSHAHGSIYQSSDGWHVRGPILASYRIPHETAVCQDGSRSTSLHHSGTCSSHGGVASWS